MKKLKILNIPATASLCAKHKVVPDKDYDIISESTNGKFLYIANPLHRGGVDPINASTIAIASDECVMSQ